MKPKRKQRKALPYCYELPRDLQNVKIVAYMQALDAAFVHVYEGNPLPSLRTMATVGCSAHERTVLEGKQGTNNPGLFRATFIATFLEQYPRVEAEMRQSTHLDMLAKNPHQERLKLFLQFAIAHYTAPA